MTRYTEIHQKVTIWAIGLLFSYLGASSAHAQLYFPPLSGTTWDSSAVETIGWQAARLDSLYRYLDQTNTKAFIVLYRGKRVVERYFDSFRRDSLWYWASAGKSMTATLVGIAQQEGLIDINQRANLYMGNGWTSASLAQENNIKVLNQLTMTSGLNDLTGDRDCTSPACLDYLTTPNTRWAYHNGPYTLLDSVIERSTGQSLNAYFLNKVRLKTAINGAYIRSGPYNVVMVSTARSFARFGLLTQNRGTWNTTPVLTATAYYDAMITSSQTINPSYGYLWWLNGKTSYMSPQIQFSFPGSYAPSAPADMFAALGRDGQICAVVPSQELVVIRMGENPGGTASLVPTLYVDEVWKRINYVAGTTAIEPTRAAALPARIFPNPFSNTLTVEAEVPAEVRVFAADGHQVLVGSTSQALNTSPLAEGLYHVVVRAGAKQSSYTVVKR
jgi:CubicO group peptidase (beta-lactamase class C family)